MEVVIDSNFLRSPELRAFLALSRHNKAVLTDYSAMEAYKNDDPLAAMQAQMAILSDYPTQVIVLKGTTKVCGLRGRKAGLRRRMVDQDQTKGFPEFCRHLRERSKGIQTTVGDYAATARSNIDAITRDMTELSSGIVDMAKVYDAEELRILRTGGDFTDSMMEKFTYCSMMLAAQLHKKHPHSAKQPAFEELPNTFLFRAAVCSQLMVLRWAETGRTSTRPEKLRNDLIDLNFATFATFFDDFFTDDKRAHSLYAEAKVVLSVIVPNGVMP
jgi:hypothetical protein